MSGVTNGTRLEQLQALRRRIDHEIAIEAAHAIENNGRRLPPPVPRPEVSAHGDRLAQLLQDHGLTARLVKEWAVEHGLLDSVRRGRVASELVHAYIAAQDTR